MKKQKYDFDAIVVGSGISGGWAAKELTEKGLKVLMVDRGKALEHAKDYYGEHAPNWKVPFQGKPNRKDNNINYPMQSTNYAFSEKNKKFFVSDIDNPFSQPVENKFDWIRSDVVGGRSVLWGRQTYRLSEQDFKANEQDGEGIPWPITYKEIDPWYTYVEKFIGVSGQKEGLDQLPDGDFLPPMKMTALEKTIKSRIEKHEPDITMTIGRAAILTQAHNGRAPCHYCGPCYNGCSTGSYFSTQSSTLPAAKATGNLTLMSDMLVEKLEYDHESKRITSVKLINTKNNERSQLSAKLFFVCASTIGTTQILLNSKNEFFPDGLANSSGSLGRYLMDHLTNESAATGVFLDDLDSYYEGVRPNGTYIPRFKNLPNELQEQDFVRGYGYQGNIFRADWRVQYNQKGFGADLKESLRKPGPWIWNLTGFGECLPKATNRITLHPTKKDRFGIPQVHIVFEWSENEKKIHKDIVKNAKRIMRAAGAVAVIESEAPMSTPGAAIHEMGTARMGDDPKLSVLNKHNQSHDIPNLFVTDGSCMTSSSCVNPSITYMALTARACDYAVKALKAGSI